MPLFWNISKLIRVEYGNRLSDEEIKREIRYRNVLNNESKFCKILSNSKKPLMIIGNSAINAHNDGTNCPGVPACFPEIFGNVYGYVWIDWEASGDRTAIVYGQEEHIA